MAELASQALETFSFLTQRLNWPVPMVRWRAGREIRDLLEDEATRDEMTSSLFKALGTCRTESEVCSILNLFLLTDRQSRPERAVLIKHIKYPSILADFLLERMYGWGKGIGQWLGAHSGQVPNDFTPSSYFEEHKTAHLPPIFWHNLQELEQHTGIPFVRQWAFEWQNLCERTGIRFTRYPDYFDDTLERRAGIVGQYQQGQTEVFRSAHIRTFSLAVSSWGMPQERALDELLEHIPAISGLFDLDPTTRPNWLGSFPDTCLADLSNLEGKIGKFVGTQRKAQNRVLSFTSPYGIDRVRHGHVEFSAFLATDDFDIGGLGSLFEPDRYCDARKELTVEVEWPERPLDRSYLSGRSGRAVPICNGLLPVPHGHWMGHYFSTGIPTLASYCLPGSKRLRVRNGSLELLVDDALVSATSVWHDTWTPHYAQGGGNTRNGVSVRASSDVLETILENRPDGLKLGWLLNAKIWDRDGGLDDYKLKQHHAFVFDDDI